MVYALLFVLCANLASAMEQSLSHKKIIIRVKTQHEPHSSEYLVDVLRQGNDLFNQMAARYGDSESLLVDQNSFFDLCDYLRKAYGFNHESPKLNNAFNEAAVALVHRARKLKQTTYQKKFLKYVHYHMPTRSLRAALSLAQLYLKEGDENQAHLFLNRVINSHHPDARRIALDLWAQSQKENTKL